MTQQELIDAHHYIESLNVDETTKETCRGIMLGRFWALAMRQRNMDITDYSTKQLIDMVANKRLTPTSGLSA